MPSHAAIPAKDLAESKNFYEQLGFVFMKDWKRPQQKLEGIKLQNDQNFIIELVHHESNKELLFPNLPEVLHVGIQVPDIHAAMERIEKLGVKVIRPITEGVSVKWIAFIQDPNGFAIELFEEKDGK